MQVSRGEPEEHHKFLPLQTVNLLHQGPKLNMSMQTHVAWRINEELEMDTCLQGYGLIGVMDMWWDGSYDCNG